MHLQFLGLGLTKERLGEVIISSLDLLPIWRRIGGECEEVKVDSTLPDGKVFGPPMELSLEFPYEFPLK